MRDLVSGTGSILVSVTEFRGGVDDESKRILVPLEEGDLGENPVRFEGLWALQIALQARGSLWILGYLTHGCRIFLLRSWSLMT